MSLDKKAKLEKKQNEANEQKLVVAETLNPKFPYRMIVFPYNFFGLENLVPREEETEE